MIPDLRESGSPPRDAGPAEQGRSAGETDEAIRRRARFAWAVLLGAFALFLVALGGLIYGGIWYRATSLSARDVVLDQIIGGTVLFQTEESIRESVASRGMALSEGDRIRTTGDGQALLALPDGSVVRLWPNSLVQVRQARSSTYTDGESVVVLGHLTGHIRIDVSVSPTLERRFEVQTPQGRALLREGSYRFDVGPEGTEVAVRTGSASVTAFTTTVEALRQERVIIEPNAAPTAPMPAMRNLLENGDFRRGFTGWQIGSRNEEDGVPGQVQLVEEDGRYVARFRRTGSQRHGEAFIHQAINRDVRDETVLTVTFDARVTSHSLSGGGVLGTEYPLLVRVRYLDEFGSQTAIVRGLYTANPTGNPTTHGAPIPANQWMPVSVNLFDERTVQPRPAFLLWIEIEASGWEFESRVTEVQILAE